MEVSCDPEQAYSEGCCELSGVVSQLTFDIVSLPLFKMCVWFENLCLTILSMAVWRVCRDRFDSWKSILQMYAWTAWHSGASRDKGECTCTVKTATQPKSELNLELI